MPASPTSLKPLLVPSPTSSTAPQFIMVSEEELAPYISTVVHLPPTIPELIQCWEREHERNTQMAKFMDRVRVEATKISATAAATLSPIAAEALAATQGAVVSSSSAAPSTPSPPPTPSVVARGVVADAKAVPTTSTTTTTATHITNSSTTMNNAGGGAAAGTASATIVRGTVLTGKVVSAAASSATPGSVAGAGGGGTTAAVAAAPLRAVVASASTSGPTTPAKPPPGPAAAPSVEAPLISADELQVLRAKAMAMEATQQLLGTTQDELKTCELSLAREKAKLARVESDLAQLRTELTEKERETSAGSQDDSAAPGSQFAQLQISLELSETIRDDLMLKYQSVLYTLAQLNEKMTTNTREKAFLEEKNTHLEGQLQRLLMSSMVTGSPTQRSATANHAANAPSPSTTSSAGANSTNGSNAAPASRLSASDSYQKAALEKQIADLQSMTDKLTRDLRKQTARRAKAEETVQSLQKEVTDLKASALQFRRQVNESELELERAVSRKEDDERLRQLERDGNRLRTALRERTEHFMKEKTEWETARDALEVRARVQTLATQQLLRRMLAYQIREVAMRQCGVRRREEATLALPSAHTSATATPAKTHAPFAKADSTSTSPKQPQHHQESSHAASSPAPQLPHHHHGSPASSTAGGGTFAASLSAGPVGAAADTATLVNRERQLEELKSTFERRVALVEAQRKAEVQQLHTLNKELRAALTNSQEELSQKARLLDSVQQQQQQQRQQQQQQPLAFAKFPASSSNLAPVALAQSTSSLSDRRESAAAWVCRTEGGDGFAGNSMDDLSDGTGGVYSTTHTPHISSPRLVTDIERRYDPEHMSTWEAVQVENEALLDRLTTMQEEKWKLTSYVEDLQRQGNLLKDELKRNASTMNQLLAAGVLTPAAVTRGSAEGSLRALQCLLQETLQEKFALEEKLRELGGS